MLGRRLPEGSVLVTIDDLSALKAAGDNAWVLLGVAALGPVDAAEFHERLAPLTESDAMETALQNLVGLQLVEQDAGVYRVADTVENVKTRRRRSTQPVAPEIANFVSAALAAVEQQPDLRSLLKGSLFRLAVTRVAKKLRADGEDLAGWLETWRLMLEDEYWRTRVSTPSSVYSYAAQVRARSRREATSQGAPQARHRWTGW